MVGRWYLVAALLAATGLPAASQDLAQSIAAAAHAACRVASDQASAMIPGLQQTWRDNEGAQGLLAQAQERLHLASVPLQNSDCADAGRGTPRCLELDAAYRAALDEVRLVEPAARSAAQTYAIALSRHQRAAAAATRLCATALAADAARARGAVADSDLMALIQELLAQATALIAALDPAIDESVPVVPRPPAPTPAVVPVPPAPAEPVDPTAPTTSGVTVVGTQEANLTWMWEFSAETFNGAYSGDFATTWTFTGTSIPSRLDVRGTVQCTGRNVPDPGWEQGAGVMDCTATFPASATHGPLTWQGSGRGLVNWDGFLLKAGGSGHYTDDQGTHPAGIEALYVRPGLAPT